MIIQGLFKIWTEHSIYFHLLKLTHREDPGDPNYTPGADGMDLDHKIT